MIEDFEDTVELVLLSNAEGKMRKLATLSYVFSLPKVLEDSPEHNQECRCSGCYSPVPRGLILLSV